MSSLEEGRYVLTGAEILGYIGGAVLAIALLPQVIHTFQTKSTSDISYVWQAVYLFGLFLNLAYFIWIEAVAAWATLIIEIFFALLLTAMKFHLDGCRRGLAAEKKSPDATVSPNLHVATASRRFTLHRPSVDLKKPINELKYSEAVHVDMRHSVMQDGPILVSDAFRGFHIMIDALFVKTLPIEFGETLMTEMCRLAALHGVRVVHRHVETFDGTDSPPGFAAAALIDESHMSAHCYSDQGKLAFDVFTCGSSPDNTRKVAHDVHIFLKKHLGDEAKFYIHRLPRFPKEIKSYDDPALNDSLSTSLEDNTEAV